MHLDSPWYSRPGPPSDLPVLLHPDLKQPQLFHDLVLQSACLSVTAAGIQPLPSTCFQGGMETKMCVLEEETKTRSLNLRDLAVEMQ